MSNLSSEGFDLDAAAGDADNVVYELGGGVSTVEEPKKKEAHNTSRETAEVDDPLIAKSEEFKKDGNENFKAANYLEAYDMYTEAIEACPGMKGEEILKEKEEFDEQQRELSAESYRAAEAERKRRIKEGEKVEEKPAPVPPVTPYEAPPHAYGGKLAIYYNNRAACLDKMNRLDEAIQDCTVAILLNPKYTKAYMRRASAYEKTERIEDALADAKLAMGLDPTPSNKKTVARLQKLEDERLEKLKEETMGKLKDLGNSILGNFGLSIDNFKAVQDPNTGSYSISFDNNAEKS